MDKTQLNELFKSLKAVSKEAVKSKGKVTALTLNGEILDKKQSQIVAVFKKWCNKKDSRKDAEIEAVFYEGMPYEKEGVSKIAKSDGVLYANTNKKGERYINAFHIRE